MKGLRGEDEGAEDSLRGKRRGLRRGAEGKMSGMGGREGKQWRLKGS